MNLLLALFVSKSLKKATNPRHVARTIRKEAAFWVQLITEIVEVVNKSLIFMSNKVKSFRKVNTVKEVKLPENVIDFVEYKLKKAN